MRQELVLTMWKQNRYFKQLKENVFFYNHHIHYFEQDDICTKGIVSSPEPKAHR